MNPFKGLRITRRGENVLAMVTGMLYALVLFGIPLYLW